MNPRIFVPLILTAGLAACSGGGSSAPTAPAITPPLQSTSSITATGTLTFVIPAPHQAANSRRPDYVSPKTIHAALFIDGAVTPAGSVGAVNPSPSPQDNTMQPADQGTPCSSTCTIHWSTTAGQHTFAVEIDGDVCQSASIVCVESPDNIFAEGKTVATIAAGSGNVVDITLDGVAGGAGWWADTSSTSSSILGTFAVDDADDDLITTPGGFDNGPVTLSVDGSLTTGSATVTIPPNGGSSLTAPDSSGNDYPFTVSCSSSPAANGTFTIDVATGNPSGDITDAELLANGLRYYAGIAGPFYLSFPTYSCTNGVIADTGGGTGPQLRVIRGSGAP